jgi:hypothetical protein
MCQTSKLKTVSNFDHSNDMMFLYYTSTNNTQVMCSYLVY